MDREQWMILMNNKIKRAISLIEVGFILFVVFFVYMFVVRQMIADLKFSDLRRSAATTYTALDTASRNILYNGGFANKFRNDKQLVDAFAKGLNVEKVCTNAKSEECWSSNWIWANTNRPGIKLQTGQYVIAEITSATCISSLNITNTCGALYVDTNGSKAPNMVGHDMIKLYITVNGLVPAGVKEDIMNPIKNCDMIKKFNWGCTAKLLGVK